MVWAAFVPREFIEGWTQRVIGSSIYPMKQRPHVLVEEKTKQKDNLPVNTLMYYIAYILDQ